ncbi:MAG TPA: MFS transporter [Candidatus Dormibacteraeota bacterium]|nr:MFS transporter [Candidatus Dormibacteraeota bacterium]
MSAAAAPPSLSRHGDFLRLWFGQTVSQVGTQVSLIAIPLTAVVALGATPFQAGLLGTFEYLPFILVGLPAGVWVDRMARRRILIASDVGRTLALLSIPLASWSGHLVMAQLYAVGFVVGVLTVFFDVAYQSYLPSLVAREQLVEGNSRLELTRASAEIAGPGIGGALVSAVTAPIAVLADAVSYIASVASLLLIRGRETIESQTRRSSGMRRELVEGLRYVLGNRLLRSIAACTALINLFGHAAIAVTILYAVRELGLSPAQIGLWFSLGSIGGPLGALLASRVGRRLGTGPTIVLTAWATVPAWFLVPLAPRSFPLPLLITSGIIGSITGVMYNITQVSLRQAITPQRIQGRMNATMRFLVWGTIPIGSFIGGVLGSVIGLRNTLWVTAVAMTFAALPVTLSPVRRLRSVEDAMPPGALSATWSA